MNRYLEVAKIFEDSLANIENRFNGLINMNSMEILDDKYKQVSESFDIHLNELDSKISLIEKRMFKVKNPFSILMTSLSIFTITMFIVAIFSVKFGHIVRDLNDTTKMILIQSDLNNMNQYFQNNPADFKKYNAWKDKVNE